MLGGGEVTATLPSGAVVVAGIGVGAVGCGGGDVVFTGAGTGSGAASSVLRPSCASQITQTTPRTAHATGSTQGLCGGGCMGDR